MLYRKKPSIEEDPMIVEAEMYSGNMSELPPEFQAVLNHDGKQVIFMDGNYNPLVSGDYLVKGPGGYITRCPNAFFLEEYEEVAGAA